MVGVTRMIGHHPSFSPLGGGGVPGQSVYKFLLGSKLFALAGFYMFIPFLV